MSLAQKRQQLRGDSILLRALDHEKAPGHEFAVVRYTRGDGEKRIDLGGVRTRRLQIRDARRAARFQQLKGVRHGFVLAFRLVRWKPSGPNGRGVSGREQPALQSPQDRRKTAPTLSVRILARLSAFALLALSSAGAFAQIGFTGPSGSAP